MLSEKLHDFLKRLFTITNLFEYNQVTSQKIDSGGQVDAVYTNLFKAFDKVSNSILIFKLPYLFGLSERLVKLFES